jgi:hypothetical protein
VQILDVISKFSTFEHFCGVLSKISTRNYGVAQYVGPEFKSQYRQKKNEILSPAFS